MSESDNPLVEPADVFYKSADVVEPEKPTDTPATEIAEDQAPPEVEEKPDTPEINSEESEANDDVAESQFIELDGKEVDLNDVRKWQSGHLMQADYTKKTQALADERKTFDAEQESGRENLLKSQAESAEMRDTLAVLVAEDEAIDWAELKDDDPERYIELKEKADKRKEALMKVKAERETPADDPALIAEEQGKLFKANPEWFDGDGKATEAYTNDISLMNEYVAKAGFDAQEFSKITRAHHMTTILKAAKYDQLQEKGKAIGDTRKKIPVVTKPKATAPTSEAKPMHDVFYGEGPG